jgi:hypothetical protein
LSTSSWISATFFLFSITSFPLHFSTINLKHPLYISNYFLIDTKNTSNHFHRFHFNTIKTHH